LIKNLNARPRPLGDAETKQPSLGLKTALSIAFLALALTAAARAQSITGLTPQPTPTIFWSQVDTYVGLTRSVDFMFLASGTPGKDGTHPELVLGPNIDIALWNFLTHLKTNNPERSKYLTFRVGYRYVKNLYGRSTTQNTGILELTPRIPLPWGFQLADRNRIDLRGLPTQFSWRYRNRVALLRSFQVHRYAFTPYAQTEVFYNCELGEWTQYNYTFGVISRITPKVEVDTWYKRQTTITEPVARANVVGVKLLLFLHRVGN
jgi:hypothetical protein